MSNSREREVRNSAINWLVPGDFLFVGVWDLYSSFLSLELEAAEGESHVCCVTRSLPGNY